MAEDTTDDKAVKPASAKKAEAKTEVKTEGKKPAAAKPAAKRTDKPAAPKVEVVKKPSRAIKKDTDTSDAPAVAPRNAAPKPATVKGQKEIQVVTDRTQPQIDKLGRSYATGKRKNSIARVWISQGTGKVSINGRELAVYFGRPTQQMLVEQPLKLSNRFGQYDILCTVLGGGLSGQAGAIRHGLSKALAGYEPPLRAILKKAGLLTRDPRVVERKKYGKHGARRSTQWVKR